MNKEHLPVLLKESIDYLNIDENGIYVDATAGFGGHSTEILNYFKNGQLYCFEQDADACEKLKEKFKDNKNVFIINDNFRFIDKFIPNQINGIIYDLGVSSYQLDKNTRGFSFRTDALLDMRMSDKSNLTAYEVINYFKKNDLEYIIKTFGEERFYKRIVEQIIRKREQKKIKTTLELSDIIRNIYKSYGKFNERIDPATRTFQAIRIYVNDELNSLKESLEKVLCRLKKSGRIVVISFHSLEDRIVKNYFKSKSRECKCNLKILKSCQCGIKKELEIITKKPIIPSEEELMNNRRARSAKLRCAEKV